MKATDRDKGEAQTTSNGRLSAKGTCGTEENAEVCTSQKIAENNITDTNEQTGGRLARANS